MKNLLCKLENRRSEPDPGSTDSDDPDQGEYDLTDIAIILRWCGHKPVFEIIGQIAQGYVKADKPFVQQIEHNDLGLHEGDCQTLLLAAYHTLGGPVPSHVDGTSTRTLDFGAWISSRMYHPQASRLCRQMQRAWAKHLSQASSPAAATPDYPHIYKGAQHHVLNHR